MKKEIRNVTVALAIAGAAPKSAETIYFLLGVPAGLADFPENRERVGTAVIPLSDSEDIAHARDLIARGQVQTASLTVPPPASGCGRERTG